MIEVVKRKIVRCNKYGFRSFGFGYFLDEPNDLTIHIDIWWYSFRITLRK